MPNYKYTAYGKDGKEIKGSVEAEDKEAAFAAGMNDYIIKPVDISSLLQKLVAVLSSGI